MSKIIWDAIGERIYETGTKKGVLYKQVTSGGTTSYPLGVAWNGLTAFSASPDGGEANDIYADDMKYLTLRSTENFKGTIEAYTYPDEFAECDGSAFVIPGVKVGQQTRKTFGFSFVSTKGNDTQNDAYGYIIHLIWGATASPSEKSYSTINDSPEAISFSWEISTVPTEVGTISGVTYKPFAHMEIDSTKFTTTEQQTNLAALEEKLYGKNPTTVGGNDGADPWLPLPAQVIQILNGTYTGT